MSTRRARIKAVTSLPPRRKNADNADNKAKPAQTKEEELQNSIKSPLTPKSVVVKNDEVPEKTKSPPALLPLYTTYNSHSKINSPQIKPPENQTVIKTPKLSQKVSVNTSGSSSKSVFASPQLRTDSPIRNTSSPLVTTLRTTTKTLNVGALKLVTPHRKQSDVKENFEHAAAQETIKHMVEKPNAATVDSKSDVPDDYSVPSVPESVSEDAVMDGIVPLQHTRSVPKPIDLLKSEIISENAEVLFDPIVPLPSPSKVRPKLRPVPRLAPLRRNSIQGSASESEDESRRALLNSGATTPAPPRQRHDSHTSYNTLQSINHRDVHRIRNDSVSSSISQVQAQPPVATSPMKDKQFNKARRQEMTRRMTAIRRRRETVKRDALTMYDLIFYNPTTNPIVPDRDEMEAKEANKREEAEREATAPEPDEPPASETPVPQIKIGPNGQIILDETSLVIKQTDSKRKLSSVVREGAWGGGGGKYTRSTRTADWSAAETVRFYRALAAIGTDFTLMAPLFPDRNRRDLKIKFKKEEKVNVAQVDKALRSATTWDAMRLQEEFEEERAAAAAKAREEKERLVQQRKDEVERQSRSKQLHVRKSKGSRAMETSVHNTVLNNKEKSDIVTVDDILLRAHQRKQQLVKERKEAEAMRRAAKNATTPISPFATLTLLQNGQIPPANQSRAKDMVTISKVAARTPSPTPINLNTVTSIPPNIESGSLVVLTVNDPNSPSKKMLQTYIAHGAGRLTPVALPPNFLNTVVGYMKKGTPKSNSTGSPQVISPGNSQGRTTPSVIQLNPSPSKRQRHNSYTITNL